MGNRKPSGYWRDFDNVVRELLAFIAQHGQAGVMPTHEDIVQAGCGSLTVAIVKYHGGFSAVAQQLGLTQTYQPRGYWRDFEAVKGELNAFVVQHGQIGVMPSAAELRRGGYYALVHAIRLHGGFEKVAQRLNWNWSTVRRPFNHWDDFDNLERELRAYVSEHGEPSKMPTVQQLRVAGRQILLEAIHRHGGMAVVANRMGLTITPRQRALSERWQQRRAKRP